MQEFWLAQDGLASAADVESAEAVLDCDEPAVLLTFDRDATTRLAIWSNANRGALLAVLVDGEPIMVASVKDTLGGKMALRLSSGKLNEAEKMASRLMGAKR
ncbi:SecDF P1 head subdomain-containing protein [Variovorax sp. UC122_21]|uniref:SecDF P1 head subdomain-containing protein n=1 Tax=Variovorax sp. UC122_21 TaxID=3374554 RepID=UPI003757963F